jgi:hypothetical protein
MLNIFRQRKRRSASTKDVGSMLNTRKKDLPPLFGTEGYILNRLPSVESDGIGEGSGEEWFGMELPVVEPLVNVDQKELSMDLWKRIDAYQKSRVCVERADSRVVQGPCFMKGSPERGFYVQIGEGTVTESVYGEEVIRRIRLVRPWGVGQEVVVFNSDWDVQHGEVCRAAANGLRIRMKEMSSLHEDTSQGVEAGRVGVVVKQRKRARS